MDSDQISTKPPQPVFRAPLKVWCDERGISIAEMARRVGLHQQTLEKNLLNPGHKRFATAGEKTRELVAAYTQGAVSESDWPERSKRDAKATSAEVCA